MVLCYARASEFGPIAVPVNFNLNAFGSVFTENAAQINPDGGTGVVDLAPGGIYVVSYRATGVSSVAVPPVGINFTTELYLATAAGGALVAVPGSRASQDIFDPGIGVPVNASVAGYGIVTVPTGTPNNYHLTIRNISIATPGVAEAADTFIDFSMIIMRIR